MRRQVRGSLIAGAIVEAAVKSLLTACLIGLAVFGCGGCAEVSHTGGQKIEVHHSHDDQHIKIDVHRVKRRDR